MHVHQIGWSSALFLWCLPLRWFVVVGLQQLFFCWRNFILFSIFGIIKLFNPPYQVHSYVIPPRLLEKVAVSWSLGALLLLTDPSCAHFPFVHKYLLGNYGKGLWGCPCLDSVSAWQERVLRLHFSLPLLFGFSSPESAVAASVAFWLVAGGVGYWIHLWWHCLLVLVRRLLQWLELYLVLGCILSPGVSNEMVIQKCGRPWRW